MDDFDTFEDDEEEDEQQFVIEAELRNEQGY